MSEHVQHDSAHSSQALYECLKRLNIDDADAIEDVQIPTPQAIAQLQDHLLSLPRPVSSADIPYRLVRDAVFDIVQRSSAFSADELVAACHLYLHLIKLVPIAYDEAAFTAVINLMTNLLKRDPSSADDRPAAGTKKKPGNSASAIFNVSLSCWKVLTEISVLQTFAQNFAVIGQITANGFAQLLLRAPTSTERSVSTSGLKLITRVKSENSAGINFTFVYKALVPIILTDLRAPVRTDLINLLLAVGAAEKAEVERIALEKDAVGEDPDEDAPALEDASAAEVAPATEEDLMETDSLPVRTTSGSSDGKLQFVGFLHYCCANIPEKSDHRKTVFEVVTRCMDSLDSDAKNAFVETFPRLSQHPRSTVRVFMSNICAKALLDSKNCQRAQEQVLTTVSSVLCGRTRDKIPAVRAKALSSLATVLSEIDFSKTKELVQKLCSEKTYFETLARDDKVSVRKSYVLLAGALVRVMLMNGRSETASPASNLAPTGSTSEEICAQANLHDWLDSIRVRSSDATSSVRKAVILELTSISLHLMTRSSPQVQREIITVWTSGVLPRIEDDEITCQEACIDSFSELFIESLAEEGNTNCSSNWEDDALRTQFLNYVLALAGDEASSISEVLHTVMGRASKKTVLPVAFLKALEMRILVDQNEQQQAMPSSFGTVSHEMMRNGTWALFAECLNSNITTAARKKLRVSELYKCALVECSQSSGQVAAFFSGDVKLKEQNDSVASLIEKLFKRTEWNQIFWRKSVRAIVETIAGVEKLSGSSVLERCENELDGLGESTTELEHLTLLAIIGECCSKLQLSSSPAQPLLNFVLAMANLSQPSTAVRASAVLTLGKICLAEGTLFCSAFKPKGLSNRAAAGVNIVFFENFARSCLPLFIRELQDTTAVPVRNNCILVLSDLCRRYTAIVEPYQTRIAARLADPSEMIRCHVLGSIGSLLQEDYIKVRSGAVFFRLALSLLDDSEQVRGLAKYVITRILHPKSHTLLSTSIIELVFVLNGCTENKKYNQFPELHIGLKSYTHRPGANSRKHYPYEVFLNSMSEDQILVLSSRICSEILTPVVDGKICFKNETVKGVLFDALAILEMIEKCQSGPSETRDGNAEQAAPVRTNEAGVQTKAALLRKVRMAELKVSLVPLLLELRGILEAERSPILESLTSTLCCILKPHRKNLEELVSDPTVLSELTHQLSRQQRNDEQVRNETVSRIQSEEPIRRSSRGMNSESEVPNGAVENSSNLPISQTANHATPASGRPRRSPRGLTSHSPLHTILQSSPKLAVFARGGSKDE